MTNLLNSFSFVAAAHGGPWRPIAATIIAVLVDSTQAQTLRLTSLSRRNKLSPMKSRIMIAVAILILLAFALPAFAHHSFAAEFDAAQRITLTGVVTKVEWTNPHVWFWINVKDEKTGLLTNWGLEMGSPNALQHDGGWTFNTMKVGMIVTVTASRAKDGSNKANTSAVIVDGKRLGGASSQGQTQ
jgi:hypothetical protein